MSLPILLFYGFAFIGLIHSFIFFYLAIKHKRKAELIITLFLFVQSLTILEYVLYWTGLNIQYHQLCNVSMLLQFLFGPLLLMYINTIVAEKNVKSYYYWHFLPAILVFIFMLPYLFSTADLKLYHYKMIKYFLLDFRWLNYFLMAHMTGYFVYLFNKVLREKRVGHLNNWMLVIVSLFGLYIACYVSYFIMVRYPWFTLSTDYFVSTGMCLSIIAIVYMAFGQNRILNGFAIGESVTIDNIYFSFKSAEQRERSSKKKIELVYDYSSSILVADTSNKLKNEPNLLKIEIVPESVKYKNSGLTFDAGEELAKSLKFLMQNEKLYRESELKLETVASKIGVAKHYVSQVINQFYGVNFFEYINLLRIEEAKQLLINTNYQSMTIIEIAYEVGYCTKNTFNNAFKRITGITPSEFRNQNKIRMN